MFLEDKFISVNITSCGRSNVRKHRYTKNSEQYIILDVPYKLYCMENREVTSSKSRDHMGRPGKGLTTSLALRNKVSNKK